MVTRMGVKHTLHCARGSPAVWAFPQQAADSPTHSSGERKASLHPDGQTYTRQGTNMPKGPSAHHGRAVSEISQLCCPGPDSALCLTLGINISHFTLEEFASYRPPWQQPSFPSLGSSTVLLGKGHPFSSSGNNEKRGKLSPPPTSGWHLSQAHNTRQVT